MGKFRELVIFDLDYTLCRKNSCLSFYLYLYKAGIFSSASLLSALFYFSAYRFSSLSLEVLHRRIFSQFLKGRLSSSFLKMAADFWEKEWERAMNPVVLADLYSALEQGHHVLILSQAPAFLLTPLAKKLEVSGYRGSEYILDNEGRFSTILSMVSGGDKAAYAKAKVKELDIGRLTVYSDCLSDLPLLELADRPICVGPARELRSICKKRNWEVIESC